MSISYVNEIPTTTISQKEGMTFETITKTITQNGWYEQEYDQTKNGINKTITTVNVPLNLDEQTATASLYTEQIVYPKQSKSGINKLIVTTPNVSLEQKTLSINDTTTINETPSSSYDLISQLTILLSEKNNTRTHQQTTYVQSIRPFYGDEYNFKNLQLITNIPQQQILYELYTINVPAGQITTSRYADTTLTSNVYKYAYYSPIDKTVTFAIYDTKTTITIPQNTYFTTNDSNYSGITDFGKIFIQFYMWEKVPPSVNINERRKTLCKFQEQRGHVNYNTVYTWNCDFPFIQGWQ